MSDLLRAISDYESAHRERDAALAEVARLRAACAVAASALERLESMDDTFEARNVAAQCRAALADHG